MHLKSSIASFLRRHAVLLLILAVAAFLRFADLGRVSFWLDESESARAALENNPAAAVEVARLNLAVPPLDYMVTWFMGRVSLDEGWLRIPAALWGVASIGVVYLLAAQSLGPIAAAVAGLLLAVSPAQIYYSQELRPYSAWFFFYWLTTLFLYQAVQAPNPRNWIKVVAAVVIGSYFHFYTLLAWFNGLGFLLAAQISPSIRRASIRPFFAAAIASGFLVLPGFLIFGLEPAMIYPQDWEHLVSQIIIPLGWFPLFGERVGFILGFSLFFLTCAGFTCAVTLRRWHLVSLAVSAALQIALITATDVVKGYFFAWRQFFALLPVTFLFAAFSLSRMALRSTALFSQRPAPAANLRPVNRAMAILILVGLVASSMLELQANRPYLKSNARQVALMLQQSWQPTDQVWVTPWFEPTLFNFYLEDMLNDTRLSDHITGYRWEDLPDPAAYPGRVYLVAPPPSSLQESSDLASRNFQLTTLRSGPRWVWLYSP